MGRSSSDGLVDAGSEGYELGAVAGVWGWRLERGAERSQHFSSVAWGLEGFTEGSWLWSAK